LVKVYAALLAVFAAFAVWSVTKPQTDIRKLQVTGGKTMIAFYPGVLEANKLKVVWSPSAEGDKTRSEPSYGFQINFSNLAFTLEGGRFSRFDGGSISHKGGFRLVSGRNSVNADQFIISPGSTAPDALQLVIDTSKEAFAAFDFAHAGAAYLIKDEQLMAGNLDLVLTPRCAQELGRPELAGVNLGYLKLLGSSDPIDGGGDVIPPDSGPHGDPRVGLDLSLYDVTSLSWIGRTGTYPNGNNALTLQTTSCNPGTVNVNWNPPMAPTHPGIIMAIYRVLNGKFEEIGWSWVKHGFLATNLNSCGTCHDPSGYFLGLNCSDTYFGGNNSDQYYLGARDEWNPLTGAWTCAGSYFSNYVNDCVRRNTGSGLSVTDHRLQALDADLGNSGATYYYEARYINAGDVNTYNNIASRRCSMTWNGSQWSFTTLDSTQVPGPTINRYGELRSTAQPQDEGDIIVAVQTTSLGGGMYHYDYAVYNHTSDRQVRQFTIPMPANMTVQNMAFRDTDQDSTNQWTGSYSGNAITWSTGAFGNPSANPLKYGMVYNFRFDTNVQPVNGSGSLGLFKPGSGPNTLTFSSKKPVLLQPVASYLVVNGNSTGGNQQSLDASDDNRLDITGNAGASAGVEVTLTAPSATPASFIVGVEGRAGPTPVPAGQFQQIKLWNWTTNAWEIVDNRATTGSDSIALVTISSNASRFVNASDNQVRAQVLQYAINSRSIPVSTHPSFDQVGIQFN
jgi:hypothetical protein